MKWIDRQQNRQFWRLALPLILSNISVALLGLTDTAVTGHLDSPHYLGGVALGGTVFNLLYWGFNFLRMGTGGLASQAFGADDASMVRATLMRGMILAVLLSLLILLLRQPLIEMALGFAAPGKEVAEQARRYFLIRIWAAPAALCNFVLLGWFVGLQNVRAPFMLLVLINSINIALDLTLVVGLQMAVEGVALASVVGEYCGLFLAFWFSRQMLQRLPGGWQLRNLVGDGEFTRMIAINHPLLVRTLLLLSVIAFVNARSAQLGDTVIAATAVMMNFYLLAAFALDGLAHAAEAMAGEALGARDQDRFLSIIRLANLQGMIAAAGFALVYLIAGQVFTRLLTDLTEVQTLVASLTPLLVALPLCSASAFILDGIYTGATWSRQMRDSMALSCFLVFVPVWYLTQSSSIAGLWLAFLLFNLARGASLGWLLWRRIRTGRVSC